MRRARAVTGHVKPASNHRKAPETLTPAKRHLYRHVNSENTSRTCHKSRHAAKPSEATKAPQQITQDNASQRKRANAKQASKQAEQDNNHKNKNKNEKKNKNNRTTKTRRRTKTKRRKRRTRIQKPHPPHTSSLTIVCPQFPTFFVASVPQPLSPSLLYFWGELGVVGSSLSLIACLSDTERTKQSKRDHGVAKHEPNTRTKSGKRTSSMGMALSTSPLVESIFPCQSQQPPPATSNNSNSSNSRVAAKKKQPQKPPRTPAGSLCFAHACMQLRCSSVYHLSIQASAPQRSIKVP